VGIVQVGNLAYRPSGMTPFSKVVDILC